MINPKYEGHAAYENGYKFDENPYPNGWERASWFEGWLKSEQDNGETPMIDKNEQRRRAEELSQKLAASGQVAPQLKWPDAPVKVPVQVQPVIPKDAKLDCAGKILAIGDRVATTMDGYVSSLVVGTIIGFAPKKIKIAVPYPSHRWNPCNAKTNDILKFPAQVAKV